MAILRATAKVLKLLGTGSTPAEPGPEIPTGALGDWFVNCYAFNRRPLLLLVSSRSLLPILIPGRDVKTLPQRLPEVVSARLLRLGIDQDLVRAEVEAMAPVVVAKTNDRSVLGSLNDFAKVLPYYLESQMDEPDPVAAAERKLERTPCRATRPLKDSLFPDLKTRELLEATWN